MTRSVDVATTAVAWSRHRLRMPRPPRVSLGGMHYHVLNRGNQRARVFHDDDDYATFIRLLVRACERFQMRVQALAVLPNHFHAILLPKADGDLSRFMQMLTARQAEHDRVKRGTTGHLWQGRFRSFPIQSDRYLL